MVQLAEAINESQIIPHPLGSNALLAQTELLILSDFDDFFLVPTAIEFARMLLFIANNSEPFTNVY